MEKKKVFVIMPFKDEFFEVYEMLKTEFAESFEFTNAGDEGNQQNILKDIIQPIYEADVVIADLTGLNPNVMYELGIAHTFNKKTITITQDDLSKLPFDLKQYRAKDYNTHFKKFAELVAYLKTNLNGAIDNSVRYGNPVKDFMDSIHTTEVPWFSDKDVLKLSDNTDKGFIDFLADIEENAEKLTQTIEEMTADMQTMNQGVSNSSSEIERVSKNGGNSQAAFVRKETKKIAKCIDTFSQKLRVNNQIISDLWDELEKDSLGLIESPLSSRDQNKESLKKYLISLNGTREAAIESATSIDEIRTSLNETKGLERSLNQAVRFVDDELSKYISFTERLGVSVEKIIGKARFVVGEIDIQK